MHGTYNMDEARALLGTGMSNGSGANADDAGSPVYVWGLVAAFSLITLGCAGYAIYRCCQNRRAARQGNELTESLNSSRNAEVSVVMGQGSGAAGQPGPDAGDRGHSNDD